MGPVLAVTRLMWRHRRTRLVLIGAIVVVVAVGAWTSRTAQTAPSHDAEARDGTAEVSSPQSLAKDERVVTDTARAQLLRRAQLWRAPETPVERASFSNVNLEQVICKFKVSDVGGTAPKFDCVLENGEEIRIKYGNGPEVPAEAAATRLLSALGFGADEITLVRTLRCYGCPDEPFSTLKTVEIARADELFKRVVDYTNYEDFQWVALERRFQARPVETEEVEGWSFFELDAVDERAGGAPRAHVDALRLTAILLAHWDNKSENQRIVCLSDGVSDRAQCDRPFLLLQDVGATFGPIKMNLDAWEKSPIWEDRARCGVSMKHLPYDGATFSPATITEDGRRFLAGHLSRLSDAQLTDLFESARFGHKRGVFHPARNVADWVRVFKAKVRDISEGPPCPPLSS